MFSPEEALWLKIALKKEFITKDQIAYCLQNPQKQKAPVRELLCEFGYLNATQVQFIDQIWKVLQQKQSAGTTSIPATTEVQNDKASHPPDEESPDQEYKEVPPDEEVPLDEEPILTPLSAETTSIPSEPRIGEESFQKAMHYLEAKQMIQAMNLFEQVLQENPQFAEAYYHKGKIHLQLTEVQEALEHFSKAIDLQPRYVEALESRGSTYLERGDRSKAEADFLKVIELCPEKQEVLSQRFYYPNVSDKSELQKLMLLLKLEKKQGDLQKNMQTQRVQLLTNRFDTKKIVLVAQQLEAEKNKTRKVRDVDPTRSRSLNIGGDTQFVDLTTSEVSKSTNRETDSQELENTPKTTTPAKPKKIVLTEESFTGISNIFSGTKKSRASTESSRIQDALWLLVFVGVVGGYFYNRAITPLLTSQTFLYPISSADYVKWEKIFSTLLENFPTSLPPAPPKNLLDWVDQIEIYRAVLQQYCAQHQYLLRDFLELTRALGQVQSYLQGKRTAEQEIQKLAKMLETLEKRYAQKKEEAELQEKEIPAFEEELFLMETERIQKEIERQENGIKTAFAENLLDPVLRNNLKFYQSKEEVLEPLWLNFLRQWSTKKDK